MMVSVFKTSIEENDLMTLGTVLDNIDEITTWNTDLEDCDKILRVEGHGLIDKKIIDTLAKNGYLAEELEDFIPRAIHNGGEL